MEFTPLQLEIIHDRIELPCAMSEVLAEEMGISFQAASDLVEQHLPDLVEKIESEKSLNEIESSLAHDIQTNLTYVDTAADALGDNFPSPSDPIMTQQKLNGIARAHENMVEKIKAARAI